MLRRLKHFSRWTTLTLCSLIFAVLLVACGESGTGGTTPTSPTPTPTTLPMTTFQGNGFTMSYPQNWQTTKTANNLFTFTDSAGTIKMTITVAPDPTGAVSADALAQTGLKAALVILKNPQTISVPPTTTIGGDTWSQQSASGTQTLNNQNTDIQLVVLADVHPANALASKGYTIEFHAPTSMFAQANTTYFQPMLQSFKFV